MGDTPDNHAIAKWDPTFVKQVATTAGEVVKRWFRAEVRTSTTSRQSAGRY